MTSTTESGRVVPVSGQSGAKAPAPYQGFDEQYIDGSWRPGKHGGVRVDTDPFSGATLAETVMANQARRNDEPRPPRCRMAVAITTLSVPLPQTGRRST